MTLRQISPLALLLALAACAEPRKSEVTVLDSHHASGAYVLAYTADTELRVMFEDQLVTDLAARDMKAYRSYPDLPDVRATDRDKVLEAAMAHNAMFILVVEEVRHGQAAVVEEKGQITHKHPTLRDFYQRSKPADHPHEDKDQIFVEVSAFLIQGNSAKLYWSGTTWSFQADGQLGRISALSNIIAEAIDSARLKMDLRLD